MRKKNGKDAPMAEISAGQPLDKEDQIDEQTFNQAIWKSVKGADSVMPAPRHDLLGDSAAMEKKDEDREKDEDGAKDTTKN